MFDPRAAFFFFKSITDQASCGWLQFQTDDSCSSQYCLHSREYVLPDSYHRYNVTQTI